MTTMTAQTPASVLGISKRAFEDRVKNEMLGASLTCMEQRVRFCNAVAAERCRQAGEAFDAGDAANGFRLLAEAQRSAETAVLATEAERRMR